MTLKHICRYLLPQDTRSAELTSAFAMIALSIAMQLSVDPTSNMRALHPVEFWITTSFIFGSLQLYSIIRHQYEKPVRLVTSWFAGLFWVWVSISAGLNNPGDVATLALGISNWISFLINIMILSESWKE